MADEDHADAGLGVERLDRLDDTLTPAKIEVGRGFIEQEQFRLLRHGTGDDGLALFASGDLTESAGGQRSQAKPLNPLVHGLPVVAGERMKQSGARGAADGHHFPHRQRKFAAGRQQLRHVANPAAESRQRRTAQAAHVFPQHCDFALRERRQAETGAKQGGLARPVRTHERNHAARLDAQMLHLKQATAGGVDGEAADFEGCRNH